VLDTERKYWHREGDTIQRRGVKEMNIDEQREAAREAASRELTKDEFDYLYG
jgi:hypothetical protein